MQMPAHSANPRSKTADEIMDIAEALVQTRGYSAFSYQDIADQLGIRKASIHYHFPSKTALGIAVINRYAERFSFSLAAIAADQSQSSMRMLDHYMKAYEDFASTPDRVCLCGALAGEMMALPAELRSRVDLFFREHQAWLVGILQRGVAMGEFRIASPPAHVARMVFGALQGALLVKRTTGDAAQLNDVIAALKLQLTARAQ
jgi:TetR/AcrR family transcriptional repressor of nem operon